MSTIVNSTSKYLQLHIKRSNKNQNNHYYHLWQIKSYVNNNVNKIIYIDLWSMILYIYIILYKL